MDKLMKSIPLVILGILSPVLLVFVDGPPEEAFVTAGGEICAVTDTISSAGQARIESLTADRDKEYLVEDFSG